MNLNFVRLIFFLSIIFVGCSPSGNEKNILEIGKYKLTVAEYEKLKRSQINANLTDDQFEKKIIDDGYIIAYSLENRFDTIRQISKKLEYFMRLYASKVDGYVWSRNVKPKLEISSEEIKAAYLKGGREFIFEVINVAERPLIDKYIVQDSDPISEKEFDNFKSSIGKEPGVNFSQHKCEYPFYPFGNYCDVIANSIKGDVLGPYETLNGFALIRIVDINKSNLPEFEKVKAIVEKTLLQNKIDKFILESQNEIFNKANLKLNEEAISQMASKFNIEKRTFDGINNDLVLMEYNFNGKQNSYKVSDFLELINFEPFIIGSLSNTNDIKGMIKNNIIDVYLYDEALKMNAENDSDYLWHKEQYRNRFFIEYFMNKNMPALAVSDQVIQKFYGDNIQKFSGFKLAKCIVSKHEDKEEAFKSRGIIARYCNQNSINDIKKKRFEVGGMNYETVDFQMSDTTLSPVLVNSLLKAKDGQVLLPTNINGEFWVICLLKKDGSAIIPYEIVKEGIRQTLLNELKKQKFDSLLSDLKARYPIKTNFNKDFVQN
jgi:hypothetical protein